MKLTLFGSFELRLDSRVCELPTRGQALLAFLALRRGQPQQRDTACALLWGEKTDESARGSLRTLVHQIREALGPYAAALISERETVALDPVAFEVDVLAFEELAKEESPDAMQQVVDLYRGELLEGIKLSERAFEEWLRAQRKRLHDAALETLEKLLVHQMEAHATESAIQTALRLLTLDPLEEPVHRALMQLYASQGRWGEVQKQHDVCVSAIREELKTEPEPATEDLYRKLLHERHTSKEPMRTFPDPSNYREILTKGNVVPRRKKNHHWRSNLFLRTGVIVGICAVILVLALLTFTGHLFRPQYLLYDFEETEGQDNHTRIAKMGWLSDAGRGQGESIVFLSGDGGVSVERTIEAYFSGKASLKTSAFLTPERTFFEVFVDWVKYDFFRRQKDPNGEPIDGEARAILSVEGHYKCGGDLLTNPQAKPSIRLFMKGPTENDHLFGCWNEIEGENWRSLTLNAKATFDEINACHGSITRGFDPQHVRRVGFQIALNDQLPDAFEYNAFCYIDQVEVRIK